MTAIVAPAFDLELPDPPPKAKLLDKVDRAKRRAHGEPDPDPTAIEPDVDELPVIACPICGCDVSGCALSIGDDGLRRWTQPTKEDWPQGWNYYPRISGGLVHIEGGRRCLSDAEGRTR